LVVVAISGGNCDALASIGQGTTRNVRNQGKPTQACGTPRALQPAYEVRFIHPQSLETYSWTTSTWGGRGCVAVLAEQIGRARLMESRAVPLVAFESAPMPIGAWNKSKPVLRVTAWRRDPFAEMTTVLPAGGPKPIEHKGGGEGIEDVVAEDSPDAPFDEAPPPPKARAGRSSEAGTSGPGPVGGKQERLERAPQPTPRSERKRASR
jgi:hypothetical protein